MRVVSIILLFLASGCFSLMAEPVVDRRVHVSKVESEEISFRVIQEVRGLENPWALEFLPDRRILVTERTGRLWVIEGDRIHSVAGVPDVYAKHQGGLMDVISHPDFEKNRIIYLSYAAEYDSGTGTRVARAELDGFELKHVKVIFEMKPAGSTGIHYGSRFAFDQHGFLFITLGERGERQYAQKLDNHRGKIVRLHDDGRVPEDNPFVGKEGALPENFSYGHRNPQGLVFDALTGLMWSHEHGPRGGDALHIVRSGINYGWPRATYGREYSGPEIGTTPDKLPDIQNPIIHWTPSIAPCGLTQLRGGRIPEWEGNLFAGALVGQHIRRIVLDGESVAHQEILLEHKMGRIREVSVGLDGHLWFTTDVPDGGIYRIERVEEPKAAD